MLTQTKPHNTTFALPPSSNSDPGSDSGPSSPLPTTVRAFILIARRIPCFLPSSTRLELYLHTLLGALSSYPLLYCFFANKIKSYHGGNRTQGPTISIVVFEGNHYTTGATGTYVHYTNTFLEYKQIASVHYEIIYRFRGYTPLKLPASVGLRKHLS